MASTRRFFKQVATMADGKFRGQVIEPAARNRVYFATQAQRTAEKAEALLTAFLLRHPELVIIPKPESKVFAATAEQVLGGTTAGVRFAEQVAEGATKSVADQIAEARALRQEVNPSLERVAETARMLIVQSDIIMSGVAVDATITVAFKVAERFERARLAYLEGK